MLPFSLATAAGLLFYLSSPGSGGHGLIAWFALVPLLLALRGLAWRQAALLGLLAGLVYYLPLLRWITVVLGEHGGVAPPVAGVALLLLALYMSLYPACFAALLVTLSGWNGGGRRERRLLAMVWAAPVIWVGLDLLRAWLFTGFPWLDLAYSQYQFPLLVQAADLAGHHGITFVIVLVNGLLAALLDRLLPAGGGKADLIRTTPTGGARAASRRTGAALLLPALLLPLAMILYGNFRLAQFESATAPTITVSLIQGNIPQQEKWEPGQQAATVERYLSLSRQALTAEPALIIWPETALPFFPLEHHLFERVTAFAAGRESCLLVGTPHRERGADGLIRYYNSALLLDGDAGPNPGARPGAIYHKQHLVPFGEYIPLRRLLPFFAPIVETMGDFTPGAAPVLLECRQRRLGVLICFEAIFPGLARQMTAGGADLLVNITNDAWFGPTNAPWQHLSMAVLRAVENRRSLARAANTGISAFVLPSGRLSQATGLFVADQRSAALPLPEPGQRPTIFNAGGYLFAPFCLLLLIAGVFRHFHVIIRRFKQRAGQRPGRPFDQIKASIRKKP